MIMKISEMNTTMTAGTLAELISNCSNNVSIDELIKLESFETRNLSEELDEKRKEVSDLEALIAECDEAKAKADAQEKAKKEAEAKFIGSLTNSEREALAYLEGVSILAQGEMENLIKNVLRVFTKYTKATELSLTANLSAYVAILIKEERKEVIDLLETMTIKAWDIQQASKKDRPDTRLDGLVRILMAVQELY